MSDLELPDSATLNIAALCQIFNKTTNSYKYLFFLSLLDLLEREEFKDFVSFSLQSIFVEMLVNAWYPHNYFRLSFGAQDQIAKNLDSLKIQITKPILEFTVRDKSSLRQAIKNNNLDEIVADLKRNVPFRLIRPFLIDKLHEFDVNDEVVKETPRIADQYFDIDKPLYRFNATNFNGSRAVLLHPDWVKYLQKNYVLVRRWADWKWVDYMQKKNPDVSNIIHKLFIPQKPNLN